ncbi:MAG: SDR family oxidoreductase [Bacteroidaceae bacterium]|nr:SDR family oxidoreductase [Bacteroidaceae bacterium]
MNILITGITSGIGRAMAERLSEEGHTVYGTFRRSSEEIPGVHYLKADVRDEEAVREAVSAMLEREGWIDVFINNAGMGTGGPLQCLPTKLVSEQMDVNFMGFVRFLHYVLPSMTARKQGRIICISSIGGLLGLPFQGAYSASKFAVEGYCESLRMELKPFNISVTTINPGDFATSFTSNRIKPADEEVTRLYPGYTRSMDSIEHDEKSGLEPRRLAVKVSRIIRKSNPAARYIVATPVQKMSLVLKRVLPPKLFGRILASYYKL